MTTMGTPNLPLNIMAANRVIASSMLTMDACESWVKSALSNIQVERDALKQRVQTDTSGYSVPPASAEQYTVMHERMHELDQIEIVCREILDRCHLAVGDDPSPEFPRNWTQELSKAAAETSAFEDEDIEGASRRYRGDVALSEGVLVNMSDLASVIHMPPSLHRILGSLPNRALVVGGAVRDAIQGISPKDLDIEVYGTNYDDLHKHLSQHGQVDSVGKSFGVLKFRDDEGNDFDFSIPRRENKVGTGHKGFQVEFDPSITPKEAASRRDFTMNSVAWDPATNELLDPFGGVDDIKNKVLRHTSPAFNEDPLRVLRGMQFAARFGMDLHPDTAHMIRETLSSKEHFGSLAKERVAEEFMKLATKGKHPGKAIQFLQDTGWDKHFPHIERLKGVPQDHEWHPEGTVDVHTSHVMNEAARIADRDGLTGDDRAALVFAALAHDFAKPHTTEQTMKGDRLRWTAHGHEEAGGPLAEEFLKGIGVKRSIIEKVKPLVEQHLAHIRVPDTPAGVRTLAERLHPATIEELARLIEADHSGRPPLEKKMPDEARRLLTAAVADGVHQGRAGTILSGKDIMEFYPNGGPHIGAHMREARKLQLEGKLNTRDDAMAWLNKRVKPRLGYLNGDDVQQILGIDPGPQVGQILDQLWDLQRSKQITSREDAVKWLESKSS